MNRINCNENIFIQRKPQAAAVLEGSEKYPDIHGVVRFYNMRNGTLVYADVNGLPHTADKCSQEIFGFHIHDGELCSGNDKDPFAYAGMHLNTDNCVHPFHTGDMPPLFGNSGKAVSIFLTNRFSADEVIRKTVIIHGSPDDFTTQPSGNSGEKIACGIIGAVRRR
ncbi:MAG: superoxide dismutase family protein [Ruminococcus sp.]|nr:superoxide dismutase family protein [Ruminococcus sp.]